MLVSSLLGFPCGCVPYGLHGSKQESPDAMCSWHQSLWCPPFSPDSCLGATKGARFKMFLFQAAVRHSSSLRSDSLPLGTSLSLPFQKPCGRTPQLHPLPSSPPLSCTHIKAHRRQQDRAVQIIQCYADSPLISERFCWGRLCSSCASRDAV